jgi:hypothetical protein
MSYRDTMVALALAYRGVGMAEATRAQYLDLIAHGEETDVAEAMGKMSGCALAIRGYLRIDGHDDARVRAPYKVGTAIAALLEMAREKSALVMARPNLRPDAGDIVLVGGDRVKDGGTEHVFVVTGLDELDRITGVDGGQVDGDGLQVIRERRRTWASIGGRLWDAPHDGGAKRRVQCWIDIEKLREG